MQIDPERSGLHGKAWLDQVSLIVRTWHEACDEVGTWKYQLRWTRSGLVWALHEYAGISWRESHIMAGQASHEATRAKTDGYYELVALMKDKLDHASPSEE